MMTFNNYDDKQISMENGDEWYFDEFGEYRKANMLEDDIQGEELVPDEIINTQTPLSTPVDPIDEFHETLQSEHIDDQLNDPELHHQAEMDYDHEDKGIFEKIKDKYDDMTGK